MENITRYAKKWKISVVENMNLVFSLFFKMCTKKVKICYYLKFFL